MRIADVYFRPKSFEMNGLLYEWLGVVPFKSLMIRLGRANAFNSRRSTTYFLTDRTSSRSLEKYERRTRYNEIVHLLGMVPLAFGIAVAGFDGIWITAALAVIFVANFHSIILQRYNRIRLLRVLARRRQS